MELKSSIFCYMKYLLSALIGLYQKTLSPDHGVFRGRFPYGFCPYYPSCSEYTRVSILHHGVIKGVYIGLHRVVRCNPFAQPKVEMPN